MASHLVPDIGHFTALELRDAIRAKEISPVEVVEVALCRIEQTQASINSFAHVTADLARLAARAAEKAVMAGEQLGLLHGLPISVKDLIPVANERCEFGSRAMAGNVATSDAPVVERAKAHGACIVGKSTTSEFGCKAVGDSPLSGITRNPWNRAKTPGGSSAGAAASVVAGVTPFAIATDGGGSIRIPSSFSGTFGIKPQFGRVPMFPAPAAPTLGHIGPIANTVRDAALLLMAIAGYDRRDPYTVVETVPDYLQLCDQSPKGLRIAWSPTLGYAKPNPEVVRVASAAVMALQEAGCNIDVVDHVMPDPERIWTSEFFTGAAMRLRKHLQSDPTVLDPAVAEVLASALSVPLVDYYTNVLQRYQFRESMRTFFERYDLLATPTLPVSAFDVGLNLPSEITDRNVVNWVYYTYPFNLTGQPAASVPAGFTTDGLPVGLQLVARMHSEADIFRAAAALEEIRPWRQARPAL